MEDRRSVGASSCKSGDGTDRRVQSLMFMMMMVMMIVVIQIFGAARICSHCTYRTYIVRRSHGTFLNRILVDGVVRSVMNLLKLAPCLSPCSLKET